MLAKLSIYKIVLSVSFSLKNQFSSHSIFPFDLIIVIQFRNLSSSLFIHRSVYDLNSGKRRGGSEDLDSSCRREHRETVKYQAVAPKSSKYDFKGCTDLIENKVVKAMIRPKRVLIPDSKDNTNIGIVVSRGASKVQTTSAAL